MSETTSGGARGAFTPEEDRLHDAGIAAIREGIAAGESFDVACGRIEAADPDLRRIIVDDFLKVTIAQRHFQGGQSTEQIAGALGVSAERVEHARKEMLAEVAAASVDVFRRQSGQGPDA
jgi:hypothetical protein